MITVIILSYNNFKFIRDSLSSVFEQNYSNIELIISDDCSQDFNEEELKSFIVGNKKSNIKNIIINRNSENLGIVKNYNKAISLSSGEYIFYLAGDDVLYDSSVLKDVVEYFNKTGDLIFTGYKDVYDEKLERYIKTLPRKREVDILQGEDSKILYESLCKGSFISGSNTPFRRKLIEKYGYLDEEYSYLEDYPRYLSLSKQGCNIGFYDRKLIKYRSGGVTTSGSINNILRRDLKLAAVKESSDYILSVWNNDWKYKKNIIGWGTGDCLVNSIDKLGLRLNYLVDSNINLQGSTIDGIRVESPEKLKDESREDTFVFIFTYANYYDIASELEKIGYEEYRNFFLCTPNILDIIGGKK